MPSQGARFCCLRHLGLCDRAWWSEKRKDKAERVSFFLVPQDAAILKQFPLMDDELRKPFSFSE
jgi:hypothetical protein